MAKTCLITGAQRGIGQATAIEFAKHGYNIVIDYYEEKARALELKATLEHDYNIETLCYQADIRHEAEIIALIEQTRQTFGQLDVLVNNAAIAIDKTFATHTQEDWQNTLDTNLIGPLLVAKHAAKLMQNQATTSNIINISSTNGINNFFPDSVAYDASKAALINLTHNLAITYAPKIRVNVIVPNWVNTEMNQDLPANLVQEETQRIYLQRFAEPEEIAKVAYFLASEDASYINDAIIPVTGGYR